MQYAKINKWYLLKASKEDGQSIKTEDTKKKSKCRKLTETDKKLEDMENERRKIKIIHGITDERLKGMENERSTKYSMR